MWGWLTACFQLILWVWLSKCRYSVLVSADLQWHWYYPPRSVSIVWEGTRLVNIWNVAPFADPSWEEGYSQFSYWADFSSDVSRGLSTLIKYSEQQQLAKNPTLKALPNTLTFALSHFSNCLFITPQVECKHYLQPGWKNSGVLVTWTPFQQMQLFHIFKKNIKEWRVSSKK